MINDVDPVKGTSNPDMTCGRSAVAADTVAPASPGSTVAFSWDSGTGGVWPHNAGPMMTYMAQCTGTTCDKFDASNAKWFKIDEAGKMQDNTWLQNMPCTYSSSFVHSLSLTLPVSHRPVLFRYPAQQHRTRRLPDPPRGMCVSYPVRSSTYRRIVLRSSRCNSHRA